MGLNNVVNRVIVPVLARCVHCGKSRKEHVLPDHHYQLNEKPTHMARMACSTSWTRDESLSVRSPGKDDPGHLAARECLDNHDVLHQNRG